MTARILPFPNFFRPATPRDEMGELVVLHDVNLPVFSTAENLKPFIHKGLSPTSSFPRECPKIALLRRQSKQWLREHFKRELSGGEHG